MSNRWAFQPSRLIRAGSAAQCTNDKLNVLLDGSEVRLLGSNILQRLSLRLSAVGRVLYAGYSYTHMCT